MPSIVIAIDRQNKLVYSNNMIIEQTVEIPANRQLVLNLPQETPIGKAKAAILLTFTSEKEDTAKRSTAIEKLFGCCSNTGDSLDAYMERHWADNDLERAIELHRKLESEQFSRPDQ